MENASPETAQHVTPTTRTLDEIPDFTRETAVTFGVFDGVHIGHQAVIRTLVQRAAEDNLMRVLVGFYPHPLAFLAPDRCPRLLTTLSKRLDILQQFRIDETVMLNFGAEIAAMSPERFVERVLLEKCQAKHVVVGYACQFGKDRAGNAEHLVALSKVYGFDVSIVPPTRVGDAPVHSTRIREVLAHGDLHQAAALLGRPYSVTGTVVHGDGRGREIGFPTANLETDNHVYPPNGVYAIRGKLEGRRLDGVLNIGMRPTFDSTRFQVEAHFFDFNETIYGEPVEIFFVEKIRDEQKFANPEILIQQIRRDVAAATEILTSGRYPLG